MAMAAAGLVSLPAWANGWTRATVQTGKPLLPAVAEALLAEVAETILPATETPGAKALGVHQFIQKIVTDCLEPSAQQTLSKGLTAVESLAQQTYGKAFAAGDAGQRMDVLKTMEQSADADQKAFFGMVKGLTIRGYLTSEYVMTNLTHFEFAPGRYHGCVPVKQKPISAKE